MYDLPEHLAERCRMANSIQELHGHGPIVVWLKSSLRTHENPALDAGRILANKFNRPLLIYQGIDERYPHAMPAITTSYWMLLLTCIMVANNLESTMFCMLLETAIDLLS